MSVLVSKRRESKAEYVNTARELLVKVLQQVKKLPKSITFYITQDVVKHIRDCYTSVCIANSIYLNKENYDLRKSYLQNAQCSLAGFESLFNLVFDTYYSCLTPHQWEQIGSMLSKEKSLIKSVLESDKKVLG